VTAVWVTIAALTVVTVAFKTAGPLILGGRRLPPAVMAVIGLLASSILAALVVVETLSDGRSLELDARALGVGFAAVALAFRVPLTVAVIGAAVVAAGARALA
jgi:branched-subunit amino acid transport protein